LPRSRPRRMLTRPPAGRYFGFASAAGQRMSRPATMPAISDLHRLPHSECQTCHHSGDISDLRPPRCRQEPEPLRICATSKAHGRRRAGNAAVAVR
jgi:hypothetical protein